MAVQYGLTLQGFVPKRQSVIKDEIQTALQQAFGANINLAARSVFGQLTGIFSEREALLWELAEAVYASQYPSGAEGTSVDNILALNNLRRLQATPSRTAPTDTNNIPGLVLLGTPSTLVPAGSIIQVSTDTSKQYTLDADVTILAAVDAIQQLSFFGGIPTQGVFTLSIEAPSGAILITDAINWDDLAAVIEAKIQALYDATEENFPFTDVAVSGSIAGGLVVITFGSTAPLAGYPVQTLTFIGTPTAGSFQIVTGEGTTASIPFTANALAVQTALQAVDPSLAASTVEGSFADGFRLALSFLEAAPVTTVNALTGVSLINVAAPSATQPSSGEQPQQDFDVPSSTLQDGSVVVNANIQTTTVGAPAQGIGSATATITGPNPVPAGFLTVIGSPTLGWASVNNPQDIIPGTNRETDTEALQRRSTLLATEANGPLDAIVEKVALVSGVQQAVGFENLSLAAEQLLTFVGTPSAGYFRLTLNGIGNIPVTTGQIPFNAFATTQVLEFTGTPSAGDFTITIGTQTTAAIPFNATSAGVQSAIRLLTGSPSYATVIVSGTFAAGFSIAFGLLPQKTITTVNSLTGVSSIDTRASVQSRVNDITQYEPALITGSYEAGFKISFQGSAGGQPQLLVVPLNSLTGSTITADYGLPGKAFEIVINDNNGEADDVEVASTIMATKPAGIQSYGNVAVPLVDSSENTRLIYFSRPTQLPIYIKLSLITDLTSSARPLFNAGAIPIIQEDLVAIGRAFPIGGTVIGFGSGGLIGGFNQVPGVISYTLYFGTAPNPVSNNNISLQSNQAAEFETQWVVVEYQ